MVIVVLYTLHLSLLILLLMMKRHCGWFWLALFFSSLVGHILGCSLAKPQADKKFSGGSNSQKSALLPSYPPWVGYGLLGGAPGAGYGAAGFGQVSWFLSFFDFLFLFPHSSFFYDDGRLFVGVTFVGLVYRNAQFLPIAVGANSKKK